MILGFPVGPRCTGSVRNLRKKSAYFAVPFNSNRKGLLNHSWQLIIHISYDLVVGENEALSAQNWFRSSINSQSIRICCLQFPWNCLHLPLLSNFLHPSEEFTVPFLLKPSALALLMMRCLKTRFASCSMLFKLSFKTLTDSSTSRDLSSNFSFTVLKQKTHLKQ